MATLALENVSKIFPGPITAVDRLTLEVPSGELLVLLGPSGSGKTTVLRLIAGLERLNYGSIRLSGAALDTTPPRDRGVSMVFQYPALLPQLTVRENVALGPKLRKVAARDTHEALQRIAALLQIEALLGRKPESLSGGQQQRVALARALVNQPKLLLLDEPLANLDPIARSELRAAIKQVQRALRLTTLYVTHDQLEAASVADRIALLEAGRLQQAGPGADLYRDPANLFVARFFGPHGINLLEGQIRAVGAERLFVPRALPDLCLPVSDDVPAETRVVAAFRPNAVQIHPHGRINGRIVEVNAAGWTTLVTLDASGTILRVELPPVEEVTPGATATLRIDAHQVFYFDSASGERLRSGSSPARDTKCVMP